MPYWINSSSNDLIKRILIKGDKNIKVELEELIAGNSINKQIDDTIILPSKPVHCSFSNMPIPSRTF